MNHDIINLFEALSSLVPALIEGNNHLAKDVYHINTSNQSIEKYQLPDHDEPNNVEFDFLYFAFHNGRLIFLMPTPARSPEGTEPSSKFMYLGYLSKNDANEEFFENAISHIEYNRRFEWGYICFSWLYPNFQLENGEFLDYRTSKTKGRARGARRGPQVEAQPKAKLYKTKIKDFISATQVCSCQGNCKEAGFEFTHHGVTKKMKVFTMSKVQSKITLMNKI